MKTFVSGGGQPGRAIEQYKKYLSIHPDGSRAPMVKKNLRDLESKISNSEHGERPEPAASEAPKPEPTLPRPPPEEPPP